MNQIRHIQKLNEEELKSGTTASWHDQYKDSAYINVGGLPVNLTEGDVITIFSQYGEIVDINMPRDPNTGKPRGFAWLMYADQRSTILAVDNLNGAQVLGRTLRVDHVLNYKQLERDQETGKLKERDEQSFAAHPEKFLKKAGESDGSESDSSHGSIDPDDPMRDYLISQRRERKKKRKADGGGGGDESKEEKRRRKAERRRIREEREARKARRGDGRRPAIDDGKRARGSPEPIGNASRNRNDRPASPRRSRSPERYRHSNRDRDPLPPRSRHSPDRSRHDRRSESRDDLQRDRRAGETRDERRTRGDEEARRGSDSRRGGSDRGDAFADLERWARGA